MSDLDALAESLDEAALTFLHHGNIVCTANLDDACIAWLRARGRVVRLATGEEQHLADNPTPDDINAWVEQHPDRDTILDGSRKLLAQHLDRDERDRLVYRYVVATATSSRDSGWYGVWRDARDALLDYDARHGATDAAGDEVTE